MKRFALLMATLLCCALLVMAAAADGTWNNVNPGQGAPLSLALTVNNNILSGTADGAVIGNGKVQGANIWFTAVRSGVTYTYKGTIAGNVLNLSETRQDGTGLRNMQFLHQ